MRVKLDIKSKAGEILSVSIDGIKALKRRSSSTQCRQVFIWQDLLVIKFDSSYYSGDFDQCVEELELVEKLDEEDKQYFVLPLDFGVHKKFTYVVQEFIRSDDNFDFRSVALVKRLETKYDRCDFRLLYNVGIVKGQVRIFDYAF